MSPNTIKFVLLAVFLVVWIGCSQQQETSSLLETYNNVENLFETYSKQFSAQTQSSNTRILVHVKIWDNVIMTDEFLNRMASLMSVENYKEFQFHSEIPIFSTRLTPQQIHHLSHDHFAKNSIEWIKKVSKTEKQSFSELSLESFKFGGLRVQLDSKLNENQRLQTMNRLRNWYISSYTNKMIKSLSKLNIQQIQQSLNTMDVDRLGLLSDISPLPSMKEEREIRDFIREQTESMFDLEWNMETTSLQITLANFDYGVWRLIKQQQFNHPTVKALKRREQVQKLFKQSPSLNEFIEEISTEMGQELLEHLVNDNSVDMVVRQVIHEIKNLGSNQVIQNGGGSNHTYFWNNGITGASEVVSVIDTGISLSHCFFSGTGEPTTKTTVNLNHRKVVYYGNNGGNGDLVDGDGHGTHVAGTVAGYPETLGTTTTHRNVGVAKDAKLYIVDVQKGSTGGLNIGDMSTILGNAFNSAGSRISSNSWGCANPYDCDHDCRCFQLNSDNTRTAVTDSTCMAQTGTRCCHFCNFYGTDSNRIDTYLNSNDEVTVVMAAGNDGEFSTDSNMGDPATAKNVLSVGASFSPSSYYRQFFPNSNFTLFEFENMAPFSGRGPTYDNRIKPDISAPGVSVISSLNTQSCGSRGISGTSMATPGVSGAAALIRHYMMKDNKKKLVEYNIFNNSTSQTLSGTLVKAMIIHSGENMNGFVRIGSQDAYLSQFSSPNKYNGFGRINLQNVLKIDTDFTSVNRVKNVLVANRYSLDPNSQVDVVLRANSLTTMKVTVAWYDLPSPADRISTVKTKKLINDIDLVVMIGNMSYFGNGAITSNTVDSLNTVESVIIPNITLGTNFTVRIQAKSINRGKQAFSMVITGDVSLIGSPSSPTPISSNPPIATSSNRLAPRPGKSSTIECSFTLLFLLTLILYLIQ